MQLKSITLLAASLALVQATSWADNGPSKPVDGGVATTPAGPPSGPPTDKPAPPTGGDKPPTGGEKPPVGGDKPPTGGEKPPVGGDKPPTGGEKPPVSGDQPPTGGDKPPVGGDKPPTGGEKPPVGGDKPPTGGEKPPVGGDKPPTGGEKPPVPVDGGSTSVADETATQTWLDLTSIMSTTTSATPVVETSTTTYVYWGDETSVASETTSTSTADPHTWSDITSVASVTTTSSAEHTWSDYVEPPKETPVSGGDGHPGKPEAPVGGGDGHPGSPETPVSGGDGKPPGNLWSPVDGGSGSPETPVSGGHGGNGAPPAGGACNVVTETVVNTVTVTVQPGKPTAAPAVPAVPTANHVWSDAKVTQTAAPTKGPVSGGYMGIVQEYRAQMGLPDLKHDSKLEANAQNAADSSGGALVHKLNPGSMAQVMAPGNGGNFASVFLGGWLCEMPNLPGLGSAICDAASKGWNHGGQTGHAKILTDPKYEYIGCGNGDNIWCCDLR